MVSSVRFLTTSDTHGAWPYPSSNPASKVDVLLHCGDLTQVGGLPSFKRAIEDIKSVDAELKLVIAGNHDLELDESWVRENMPEDMADHVECVTFMKEQEIDGIHYLDEGTHTFILKDGRRFSVYASPYTPEFNGYAFAYGKEEDRFNTGANFAAAGVDVVMTHGPPLFPVNPEYDLDVGHDGTHCGCEKLANAVQRVKPRLHCFGHLHEGRGAMRVGWTDNEQSQTKVPSLKRIQDEGAIITVEKDSAGSESLLVNAAMHGPGRGWLVDLML
jgi:Icc-related predicted phosphoesterase